MGPFRVIEIDVRRSSIVHQEIAKCMQCDSPVKRTYFAGEAAGDCDTADSLAIRASHDLVGAETLDWWRRANL